MSINFPLTVLVLAAGKGTRMKSKKAKVLHEVFFSPMIHHVLNAVIPLDPDDIVVVVGHQGAALEKVLKGFPVRFVEQKEQLGTGHAVLAAEKNLEGFSGNVMILCGDIPLIRTETLNMMLENHELEKSQLTVMTTMLANPANYGRIVTDQWGSIKKIVEEKDADESIKTIREINAGIYCVHADLLFSTLKEVGTANAQGEIYLTDIVEIAIGRGDAVQRFLCPHADEVLGVNSRVELAGAHACFQDRRNIELMLGGVTILQPGSVWVEKSVAIGADTILHPSTHLRGNTKIGMECLIETGCVINNCTVGNNVHIGAHSYLSGVYIKDGERVNPSSFLKG